VAENFADIRNKLFVENNLLLPLNWSFFLVTDGKAATLFFHSFNSGTQDSQE
jgi:hypothetical protein